MFRVRENDGACYVKGKFCSVAGPRIDQIWHGEIWNTGIYSIYRKYDCGGIIKTKEKSTQILVTTSTKENTD